MGTIEAIKARLDILDIISGYVTLRRAGRHYKGLCPFHEEKDPSFMVDPQKQRFRCYGCGAHGDVIDFLARSRGLDTPEAIRYAADLAGVSLDRPLSREERARLRREEEERRKRRRLREMARRASLLAERGLPRPKSPEELHVYDVVYRTKDGLDRGLGWVEDEETMKAYLRGLRRWRRIAGRILARGEGHGKSWGASQQRPSGEHRVCGREIHVMGKNIKNLKEVKNDRKYDDSRTAGKSFRTLAEALAPNRS